MMQPTNGKGFGVYPYFPISMKNCPKLLSYLQIWFWHAAAYPYHHAPAAQATRHRVSSTVEAETMCFEDPSVPWLMPGAVTTTSTGTKLLTVSLLLGKVTTIRHGEHISFRGLRYPLHQTIHDTKARPGSHDYALHFAATPACAIGLPDEFGSHRLAVLPSPRIWAPFTTAHANNRCWHADGCTPLFCLDCWNLAAEDLTNPDFWQSFQQDSARRTGRRIVPEQIWQRQLVLPKQ